MAGPPRSRAAHPGPRALARRAYQAPDALLGPSRAIVDEAASLRASLYASRRKIAVFLLAILTLVVIIGALMYMVESAESGFTSIPVSVYWAIVTLTTVGYGDISPQTPVGQFLASVVMILGYSIIAIPTGIVTVEWAQNRSRRPAAPKPCPNCGLAEHDDDARFCKHCGARLPAGR